jgi:orotate phosphoribosyltransferase
MTPRAVVELLLEVGAVEIRTDPEEWFTWASGKRAPIYCDNRILCSFPAERSRIAAALAASIRERHPAVEVIAGTATAGIPHAAWVADLLGLPMVYVRGAAKGHGQQKRVEGRPLQGESVVIVEDLVSYGGSSLSTVEAVNGEGGKVLGVQAIFSYGFPQTAARFEEAGVPCHALGDYSTLLSMLRLDEASARALRDWQAQ